MAIKDNLRTQKAVIWWRWWDEARHKSTPEKRLAFYDALMAYIFLGERPEDPLDMENPTGVDWAAYDATHYFDIIDASIREGESARSVGAPKGNQNARKNKVETNQNESENNSENNSKSIQETNKTILQNNKTIPLRKKNEERRMKNEERESVAHSLADENELICDDEVVEQPRDQKTPPTLQMVLAVANDGSKRSSGETIPEDFARDWFNLMEQSEWRDTKGIQHGMARACTSCPMNGRGLPVCFCACQGPGENLATDGQKIVTIGGMDDEASYIHKNIDVGYARERSEAKDGWVTVIDGDEGDNLDKRDSEAAQNKIRLVVFRRLIAESGQGFVELLKICKNRTPESYKERVSFRLHLPPQMEAVARSVISAIGEVTAVQWEIVRGLATGKNRAQIARLLGVKKQAVHQAVERLERGRCAWISALVKHCQ